jgi:sporulation protein YlmC with PRC-barrel domain
MALLAPELGHFVGLVGSLMLLANVERKFQMNRISSAAVVVALSASVTMPVLAQSPSSGGATSAPATHETRTQPSATTPSERNSVLTDRSDVRASKLIGSSVYNDRNEKVGSVDDVVLGKDNKADAVIVSVGGFLGVETKLVAVPYSQLRLGDTKNASSDNKVVMPGATKESLKAQPGFQYTNRG